MEQKQKITINIASRSYPLDIPAGNEEVYRLAERELNEIVSRTQARRYRDFTMQDNIAMAAFVLAVELVTNRRQGVVASEELAQLQELDRKLEQRLNALEQER